MNNSPQTLKLQRVDQFFCWALFVFLAVVAGFFLSRVFYPLKIDTDLKDLSPRISTNKELQSAINWLSGELEQRFILLLESTDEDALFDAEETIVENLAQAGKAEVMGEAFSEELLPLYREYAHGLLTEEDSLKLNTHTPSELVKDTTQKLHSAESAARLFPILEDPLNLANNFVLALANKINTKNISEDGIIESEINNTPMYYKPLFFRITEGKLNISTQEIIIKALNKAEAAILKQTPDVTLYRSGIVFFASDAAAQSKRDISIISTGSSLGVIALLWLAFRSIIPLVLPLISVVFGIGFSFAICHLTFGSVHILTIVFGASLIGIVIDYALHYFYHWRDLCAAKTQDNQKNHLYRALALSLLTSVIGYGALGFSDLLSLRQIALFSCMGLIAAWLSIVVLSPKLLSRQFVTYDTLLAATLGRLQAFTHKWLTSYLSFLFILIIAITAYIGFSGLAISDNPKNLFSPPDYLIQQEKRVSEVVNDFEPGKYVVISANNTDELYEKIQKLNSSLTQTRALVTIADWLPSPQSQKSAYAQQTVLYQDQGTVENLLASLQVTENQIDSIKLKFRQNYDKILTPDIFYQHAPHSAPPLWAELNNKQYAFALLPKGSTFKDIAQATEKLADTYFVDTLAMATEALKHQRQGASTTLIAAYFLISILLFLRFKSFSTLRMLLVPACSTLLTLATLHFSGQAITLFHIMALFLVLGLGMDYVIFAAEIPDDRSSTLLAVFVSALTSLLSFGLLSISHLTIVNAIGLTVLLGNTGNLIGTLIYSRLAQKNLGNT